MSDLSLTYTLTAGQRENVNHVQQNFQDVVDKINGNIDLDNLAAAVQALLPPTGVIIDYGGSAAPTGYLLCDGSAVSRATYADLYAVIGTAYGAGNGTTTFNLPDFQGRVAIGKGTHADVDTLGENEGEATVANRTPAHSHTVDSHTHTGPSHTHTGPSHTHSIPSLAVLGNAAGLATGSPGDSQIGFSASGYTYVVSGGTATGTTGASGTGNTGASGTGATGAATPGTDAIDGVHYQVVNKIIKT